MCIGYLFLVGPYLVLILYLVCSLHVRKAMAPGLSPHGGRTNLVWTGLLLPWLSVPVTCLSSLHDMWTCCCELSWLTHQHSITARGREGVNGFCDYILWYSLFMLCLCSILRSFQSILSCTRNGLKPIIFCCFQRAQQDLLMLSQWSESSFSLTFP